ncbi:MAG TPA: DUF47 family protein [candidate division Zixibacteria bacterium]|nr:DUF47 family protein [candidate division Zixibacteria bacterium]
MPWLVKKEEAFFDMFERATKNLSASVDVFLEMIKDFSKLEKGVQKLDELEHEGDIITHEIMDRLNRTFITPIDRDDIHAIAAGIDDVLDLTEEVADRIFLYKLEKPTQNLIQMAQILHQSVMEVAKAITSLRDLKRPRRILDYAIEINRLENEADMLLKMSMVELFERAPSPLEVIKWKEVYESLEKAIDKCEDMAVVIESVVVKNA